MKKHITFNRLLHKDKLMMVVSLILAIVLWAVADSELDALHDMTVSNVSVNVSLSKTAKDYGLRIVEGEDVKATVKVVGTRKDLRELKESSIHIEARSQNITDVESCKDPVLLDIELPTTVSAKCRIEDVSGTNITAKNGRYYLKIVCKVIATQSFTLTSDQVMMPNISLGDKDTMRFGATEITGIADTEKNVTIEGWQENVKKVKKVCAVISESGTLSKIGRFKAKLVAYDEKGEEVQGITFTTPASGEVDVIVPVIVYQQESLTAEAMHAPSELKDKLVVTPATLEVGELPEKQVLDTYFDGVRQSLTVDFDHWLAEEKKPITKTVMTLKEKDDVEQKEGVYLDRAPNQITITLNVDGYTNKTVKIALSGDNVLFECDEGVTAKLESVSLQVVLCGPKAALNKINADDIHFVIDAKGQDKGSHTVSVRPELVGHDDMWVYYATEDAYEIAYSIDKSK